jgi:hypothetical protein
LRVSFASVVAESRSYRRDKQTWSTWLKPLQLHGWFQAVLKAIVHSHQWKLASFTHLPCTWLH